MKTTVATLLAVYRGDSPSALASALDSLHGQQLSDGVESRIYIAVDGPIPVETENVLSNHQSRIYKICRLPCNMGLAHALNTLIKELEDEEFVFRMDADDWSHPLRYQTQLDHMRAHPGIDILGTDIIEVDIESGLRRRVSFSRGPADALAQLHWRVPVAHPTVCFRRRVLHHVVGYPTTGTNEDIAMWFRCAQEGFQFGNVHQPLLDFTINPGFWRRRNIRKSFSELSCYVSGIRRMHGVTWKYALPLLRFLLRISPSRLSRLVYKSSLRRSKLVQK